MGVFALTFALLAGSALGIALGVAGAIVGALTGVPLLGGAARRDIREGARMDKMVLVPFGVVLGMFLLPRVFEAIGLTIGWALATGASAFIAAAVYATSRSKEVFPDLRAREE